MRKTIVLLSMALALFALEGCGSLPPSGGPATVPELSGSDDSLVIIITETINKDKVPEGRAFNFILSGDYPPVYITPKFSAFKVREPGVMLKAISSHIGAGFRGEKSSHELEYPLPYKPGKIAFADFVFIQEFIKVDSSHISTNIDFRKTTSADRDKVLEYLGAIDGYARWLD